MPGDKSIKISLKADLKEGQKFSKFLNDLAAQGSKTAKELAKITVGGSSPLQKNALTKALMEQSKLFKELGKDGQNLARILKDQIGRNSEELTRKYKQANQELKRMVQDHSQLEKNLKKAERGGDISSVSRLRRSVARSQNRILEQTGNVSRAQMDMSADERLGGGGSGGLMGALTKRFSMPSGIGSAAAIAGIIATGATQIASTLLKQDQSFIKNEAIQGQTFGSLAVAAKRGDLSTSLAVHELMSDPTKKKEFQHYMTSSGLFTTKELGGAVGQRLSNLDIPGLLNPANYTEELKGVPTKMKVAMAQWFEQQKMVSTETQADLATFQAKSPGWVAAMRMMGGQGAMNSAFNTGAAFGLNEQQVTSTIAAIVGEAGRKAAITLKPLAFKAVAGGMNEGLAAHLASAQAIGGANVLSGTMALIGGGMDITAAGQVGAQMAAHMMSGNAVTTGLGFMGLMGAGYNGVLDIRQKTMGAEFLGKMQGGGLDPFQNSISWVNAIKNAGANASPYKLDLMRKVASDPIAAAAIMANNELPPELAGVGATLGEMQGFIRDNNKSLLMSRFIDSGAQGPAFDMFRDAIQNYDGDFMRYSREVLGKIQDPAERERKLRMFSGLGSSVLGQSFGTVAGLTKLSMFGAEDAAVGNMSDPSAGSTQGKFNQRLISEERRLGNLTPGRRRDGGFTPEEETIRALVDNLPQITNFFSVMSKMHSNTEDATKSLERFNTQVERTKRLSQIPGGVGKKTR